MSVQAAVQVPTPLTPGPALNDSLREGLTEGRLKKHDLSMAQLVIYFQNRKSYYAQALSEVPRFADPTCPTMYVTVRKGRYIMKYHPEWYKYLDEVEASTVLEHECLHILLHHIPRFNKLLRSAPDEVTKMVMCRVANTAMDCAVNTILKTYGNNRLPASAILPEQFKLPPMMSLEFYLTALMPMVKVTDNPATEAQSGAAEDLSGNGLPGSGQPEKLLTSSNPQLNDLLQGGIDHPLGLNQDEDPSTEQMDPLDLEDLLVGQGNQLAKKAHDILNNLYPEDKGGNTPGFVKEKLTHLETASSRSWEGKLLSIIRQAKDASSEYRMNDWSEDRSCLGQGIGMFGNHRDTEKFRIYWAIDTSASMDADDIADELAVVQSVLRSETSVVVKIVEFDTKIHKRYRLTNKGKVDIKVHGRGGTDFDCVFKEVFQGVDADGDVFKPDLFIVSTDGGASPPKEAYRLSETKLPLVWLLTAGHGSSHPCPGFGRELRVEGTQHGNS